MMKIFLLVLVVCHAVLAVDTRSLTGPEYTGHKYYLGFGDSLSGFMGNEVKYDVAHTHDIFTKSLGGNYIGTKFIGRKADMVRDYWHEIQKVMTKDDMYVQYSSGHGHESGIGFGLSYNEIRDNALSLPAKEIVIFIMACHSGGLVNSFNREKEKWADFDKLGRTLFVMASSRSQETSSTGPMTDDDEPGGPSGSAGSAFGHALWKALIGYADENHDGYISLGEIVKYVTKRTQQLGGHTPQVTGVYDANLIINKVPPKAVVDYLESLSDGMSDDELTDMLQNL